jgi:hypothetical protein
MAPLDDARRHRARVMAAGLESASASPEELATWKKMARGAMDGLREEFGPLGLDDDAIAWIAFNVTKVYAAIAALSVGSVGSTLDTSMSIYGMAAGALAGVYELPEDTGTPGRDGADAPSSPSPAPNDPNQQIGQYL